MLTKSKKTLWWKTGTGIRKSLPFPTNYRSFVVLTICDVAPLNHEGVKSTVAKYHRNEPTFSPDH